MKHGIVRSSELGNNWSAEHHLSLRDFCEPGDTYVDFVAGTREVIPHTQGEAMTDEHKMDMGRDTTRDLDARVVPPAELPHDYESPRGEAGPVLPCAVCGLLRAAPIHQVDRD